MACLRLISLNYSTISFLPIEKQTKFDYTVSGNTPILVPFSIKENGYICEKAARALVLKHVEEGSFVPHIGGQIICSTKSPVNMLFRSSAHSLQV